MPNIKSAKKRVLISQERYKRNKAIRSEVKTAIKKFNAAIESNNIEEAQKLLPLTISVIDSAVSKGVLHKNNAANKKSSLSKRLHDIVSGKVVIEVKKDNKTIAAEKAQAAKQAREALKAEKARLAAEKAAAQKEEEQKPAKAKKKSKKATEEVE